MVANPIAVTTGLFWDSFLPGLVHLLTSQIVSFTSCRCCSTTAFPEPWVCAERLFWEAVLPFYYMGFANPWAWKVFALSSISFNLFFKVSKFSLWRLFTSLVDSLELFETLVKQIILLISILTNFLLLIRKSTYILCRLYI